MHERAERTGRHAEDVIDSVLHDMGATLQRFFPLCLSIYGTQLQADFYIENCEGFPQGLVIEVKWQETSGSADEKFPYLVQNIRDQYPCPAIIVIGGTDVRPGRPGGAREGAYNWLRAQAHDQGKLRGVFTLDQLVYWLRHQRFIAGEDGAV